MKQLQVQKHKAHRVLKRFSGFPPRSTRETSSIYQAVLVPSTIGETKQISKKAFKKRVYKTERFLSQKFGGYTGLAGSGGYIFKEGKRKGQLGRDTVVKVESFADRASFNKAKRKLDGFLHARAREWGQETVGYELETPRKKHALFFFHKKHSRLD